MIALLLSISACGDDGASTATTSTPSTTVVALTTTTISESTTTTTSTSTTQPPTTTTTTMLEPDRLLGDWLVTLAGVILTFNDDGTHGVSYPSSVDDPFDFGPYSIDGNQITMVAEEGSEGCGGLGAGVYEVAVAEDGQSLDFTLISDDCAERRDIEGRVVAYER